MASSATAALHTRPHHFVAEPTADMLIRTTSDTLEASQAATVESWPVSGRAS